MFLLHLDFAIFLCIKFAAFLILYNNSDSTRAVIIVGKDGNYSFKHSHHYSDIEGNCVVRLDSILHQD